MTTHHQPYAVNRRDRPPGQTPGREGSSGGSRRSGYRERRDRARGTLRRPRTARPVRRRALSAGQPPRRPRPRSGLLAGSLTMPADALGGCTASLTAPVSHSLAHLPDCKKATPARRSPRRSRARWGAALRPHPRGTCWQLRPQTHFRGTVRHNVTAMPLMSAKRLSLKTEVRKRCASRVKVRGGAGH